MRQKQRGYIDLGPGWMWALAGWLMFIGALSLVGGVVYGIWWLVTHLAWVA